MSKQMKWLVPLAIVLMFLSLGTIKTVTGWGNNTSTATGTFVDSQVDTVKWTREPGVVGLSFAAFYGDTVEVVTARVLRVVNGYPVNQGAALVGDTLVNLTALDQTSSSAIAAGICTVDPINLEGLAYNATTWSATALGKHGVADAYWVIVQYNSTGNATGSGNTVRYQFNKIFSSK